jgi:ATP-dependent DNA helicase DinG
VPAILVSATLAVKGRFDFVSARLGIDAFDGLDVGTPFDFTNQARLYVATTLPEPKGDQQPIWEALANEQIVELVRASEGRALVLFTSIKHMKAAYATVSRKVKYPVKMQGQESNKALAAWFHETNEGVLFGTKSFFTGVDFQGDTCSLVIISKIPTPVPTEPMVQARCELVDKRGGSSFMDYVQPVTSLVLQQAVGRAIRHRNDRAVIAILDPRLVSKGYGQKLKADLPSMPLVDMAGVESFYAGLKQPVAV